MMYSQLQAVQVYGHRAAAGLVPENTLEGVAHAIDLGVDVIDLDITMTRDFVLICHHDLRLNHHITRTRAGVWLETPGPAIKECTYQELLAFDVGRIAPSSAYWNELPCQQGQDGVIIPTLKNVLQYAVAKKPDIRFQIEIKTDPFDQDSVDPEAIVYELVRLLEELDLVEKVEVHSFDWRNLLLLQKVHPKITTSFITEKALYESDRASLWLAGHLPSDSMPHLIHTLKGKVWCPYYKDITAECVTKAKELGLKVSVWTVDDPEDMRHMIALGVDGIITNRPDILLSLLSKQYMFTGCFRAKNGGLNLRHLHFARSNSLIPIAEHKM